jgi:hypothetical protein
MPFGMQATYPLSFFLMKPIARLLFSLALSTFALSAQAQRFAIKKDLITVDGQPYLRIERGELKEFYISSPQHERLFVVRQMTLQDPLGSATYLEYTFTGLGGPFKDARSLHGHYTKAETPRPLDVFNIVYPTTLARIIYNAHLLKDGALDPQAVVDFAGIYGTPYSKRRDALNQPGVLPPAVVVPVAQ